MYKVNLEVFQGPLDVLLHLIEKMEIDIHNVKISQLTEEYLDYIKSLDKISIENAEEYIVMAATLIHIKSKKLLPQHEEVYVEEIENEEELFQRLIEYKNYKEVQDIFYNMQEERQNFGEKESQELLLESKLMDMSAKKLQLAFKRILSNKNLEKKAENSIKYRKELSLPKIREDIIYKITNEGKEYLDDLFSLYDTREELVACFICMLGMLKEGIIDCIGEANNLKIILL
ncbi:MULTISPECIES: ScpA family protein [unclassified Gemella]|uniref:segregation and condensation protein A n=1 Tax=unclassified Gemella TaxID=2624949 RepID=UPI0015CFD60E|nr:MULTISPECIES: segregation/condensation protein A [unclassified Gemella]MBF0710180.1 segregation/condensation protein A [Gemella sp. GL1.1]NYS27524.1 segregation/condensation protein A [Gemella sp. GL1]